MGTTGLIFGAIVAAWLAYLVPMHLKKHQAANAQTDPATRFSKSVRFVQVGAEPPVDADGRPSASDRVSTPLTRRAAIEEIRRTELQAAARRRNVIVVLGVVLLILGVLAGTGVTPWWPPLIPGVLLVAFLAVARVSVQMMHRDFDQRLDRIERGCDEDTLTVAAGNAGTGDTGRKANAGKKSRVESVELGAPVGRPGTLWDPLPITRPTYVSAPPMSGRTVRTIDLTAPILPAPDNHPVVADGPEEPVVVERELPAAVGE